MANRFTPLEDNDNIVDGVNALEEEISTALDGIEAAIGEPAAAIADANVDNSDAGAKINAILGALRAKGIIAP